MTLSSKVLPLPETLAAVVPAPPLADVFRAEGGFVLRTIRRLGASEADAEDLTQRVFMVLHRRPELLNGGAPVRSVLFGVMRRVLADHRRKARREPFSQASEIASAPEQEQALERQRLRAAMHAALDRLDEPKREVFVLYELEGTAMPEVAQTLGLPLQTAYTRLYAAREIVRRALGKKDGAR